METQESSEIKEVWELPREIRIQTPDTLGEVYQGGITYSVPYEIEYWKLVEKAENYNFNKMQRVFSLEIETKI
jgi:hypothetical protein